MTDEVWKSESLARTFLSGVRGGLPFAAEQIDILLRLVAATGQPVRSLADLGCGDGILARAVLARFPAAAFPQLRATLVDFSEPMLERAQAQLAGDRRVKSVLADFGQESWKTAIADRAPFDLIISGYAIHHQPDQRKREIYAEIFELLEPGGLFVNTEHVASPSDWVQSISDGLYIDCIHGFQQSQGSQKSRDQIAQEFFYRPDKAANILAPVEAQCEWLRAIGFQDVDCYFKAFEAAIFGGRRP